MLVRTEHVPHQNPPGCRELLATNFEKLAEFLLSGLRRSRCGEIRLVIGSDLFGIPGRRRIQIQFPQAQPAGDPLRRGSSRILISSANNSCTRIRSLTPEFPPNSSISRIVGGGPCEGVERHESLILRTRDESPRPKPGFARSCPAKARRAPSQITLAEQVPANLHHPERRATGPKRTAGGAPRHHQWMARSERSRWPGS